MTVRPGITIIAFEYANEVIKENDVDFHLASERLKAMGHPTRLRILEMLREDGCCVGEIEKRLELRQSNVSQHLRVLKACGLVTMERRGQTTCYSINEPLVTPLLDCLETDTPHSAGE